MALLSFSISPADSARALISLRFVPEAAVYYAQMAAVQDGSWLVEYGRLLEAAGHFDQARRVYGLALGNSTSLSSSRWLINRRMGTAQLDTILVISVTVANIGSATARNVTAVIPIPRSHPPFQELSMISSDFQESGGMLTADIPLITPGSSVNLSICLDLFQRPGTARPIPFDIDDETLEWLSSTMRDMPVPASLPGPCVPMSQEVARLAELRGLRMSVLGGIMLDDSGFVFHAWNSLEPLGIRIDPLLFREDSLLAVAHNPTDVIPLWSLEATDGYELTLLYDDPAYQLSGTMTAEFK
jgi:hypothetical protein